MNFIEVEKSDFIYQIILNRPDKKNALNLEMIQELSETFKQLEKEESCLLIVIKAAGDTFSAGADLSWMQKQIDQTFEENLAESNLLFDMFLNLSQITKPVVTYVHHYVMGGALGLLALSDYCFAEKNTKFCFSETRLGLAPSVISPFLLEKCNPSLVQKFMMFAQYFNTEEALKLGLVHDTGSQEELSQKFDDFLKHLSQLDLTAVRQTKALIKTIRKQNFEDSRVLTTNLISKLRVEDEAQRRLKSFLKKSMT